MNWIKEYKNFCKVNKLNKNKLNSLEYFISCFGGAL